MISKCSNAIYPFDMFYAVAQNNEKFEFINFIY